MYFNTNLAEHSATKRIRATYLEKRKIFQGRLYLQSTACRLSKNYMDCFCLFALQNRLNELLLKEAKQKRYYSLKDQREKVFNKNSYTSLLSASTNFKKVDKCKHQYKHRTSSP